MYKEQTSWKCSSLFNLTNQGNAILKITIENLLYKIDQKLGIYFL